MMGVHWDLQNSFVHYGKPGLKMLGYRPDEDIFHTKQPCFPSFKFDETAKALTRDALIEDLPRLICECTHPMDFKSLFSKISNETPATSEILRHSLKDLAKEKEILIKDATGKTVRRAGVQHESDLISVTRQMRFFR